MLAAIRQYPSIDNVREEWLVTNNKERILKTDPVDVIFLEGLNQSASLAKPIQQLEVQWDCVEGFDDGGKVLSVEVEPT